MLQVFEGLRGNSKKLIVHPRKQNDARENNFKEKRLKTGPRLEVSV